MRRAQPWKTNRACELRSKATSAEERLWYELRARRFSIMKFVRLCPIEPYFVDFACRDRRRHAHHIRSYRIALPRMVMSRPLIAKSRGWPAFADYDVG